ncbi:MAG: hypothetical protein ACREBR_00990 [bacterium]
MDEKYKDSQEDSGSDFCCFSLPLLSWQGLVDNNQQLCLFCGSWRGDGEE